MGDGFGGELSAAHNWCDRRCGRCPIRLDCAVYRREEQRRWLYEARGEDAEGWGSTLADMREDMERLLLLVTEVAIEEGIDLDAPPLEEPIQLDAVRFERTGKELFAAVHHAIAERPACPGASEALVTAMTLAMKLARIGGSVGPDRQLNWSRDTVPNLLLIERLALRFDAAIRTIDGIDAPARQRLDAVRADVDRLVDPLLAEVTAAERDTMADLALRGLAPSPFALRPVWL